MRALRRPYLLAAEVALALVGGAVVFSFSRLFQGWGYLATLVPVVAYSHLVTALLRRRGVGLPLSGLVSAAGLVVLATWLLFPSTTVAQLVPSPATWDAAWASVEASLPAFRQLAPVPAGDGLLLASAAVLFLAAFLADWAAFRLWSPLESVVPYFALVCFVLVLGAPERQVATAVAVGAAALLFFLLCRAARLEATSGWLAVDPAPGEGPARARRSPTGGLARAVAPVAAFVVAMAVVVGAFVAPQLPGASSAPQVDVRAQQRGGDRVVLSPLVEIERRLLTQGRAEAFTVRAERAAYWRLTALDTFDGAIWRSGGRYSAAGGALPVDPPDGIASEVLEQEFTISGLASLWLPSAYQPVTLDAGPTPVIFQSESSTLIVDTGVPTSDGATYRVSSVLPNPTPDQLEAEGGEVPGDLEDQLDLPDSLDPSVAELAREVVERAGATTPYRQALALQDFFRDEGPFADDDHEFTYTLAVPAGHSNDAMVEFLRTGEGYCQQFAGTYAAMARSLGLPTRVAVGFTWGEVDPEDPTLYRVYGSNAHAWPEVWLGEEVGWIAFEPTKGRGSPQMGYAGVTPSQASPSDPTGLSTQLLPPEGVPGAPGEVDPGGELAPDPALDPGVAAEGPATQAAPAEGGPLAWAAQAAPTTGGRAVLGVVVAGVAYLVAVTALLAWWRHRRRASAQGDVNARVRLAWQESAEDLGLLRVGRHPWETNDEFARRAGAALPAEAEALARLARAADEASFAPGGLDPALAGRVEVEARSFGERVKRTSPLRRRLARALDPRPLWRRGGPVATGPVGGAGRAPAR